MYFLCFFIISCKLMISSGYKFFIMTFSWISLQTIIRQFAILSSLEEAWIILQFAIQGKLRYYHPKWTKIFYTTCTTRYTALTIFEWCMTRVLCIVLNWAIYFRQQLKKISITKNNNIFALALFCTTFLMQNNTTPTYIYS